MLGSALATIMGASQGRVDPAAWFGSAPGVAYDFTDLSTMRQNTNGTTAVTAVGQSVGWVRDLSRASGNHLVAPADIRRGVVGTSANGKFHVACNGARAYATTSAINFTGSDEVACIAAMRADSSAVEVIAEISNDTAATDGSFVLYRNSSNNYGIASRGTASAISTSSAGAFSSPDLFVLVMRAKIFTPTMTLSRNGTEIISSGSSQGSGSYGTHLLNVACRNAGSPSLMLNGHLSRLLVIGGPVSAGTLAQMIAWARDGNNAY